MKNLSIMIKPASSLCNLRCKYCFYADITSLRQVSSYGVMNSKTTEDILRNIVSDLVPGDRIQFAFQGGEPTLAGLDYFRNFVAAAKKWPKGIEISYVLQTNGILIDNAWCELLKENDFLVGLSLDLLPSSHDRVRVTASGEGTFRPVVNAMELMKRHKVEFNILCTLTNEIARHPQQIWKQIQSLDLQYVQFTPCLGELDQLGKSVYALTPKRFASFYQQLFRFWYQDYVKGQYRSIKFFDDVVNLMAYGIPTACGIQGTCHPQLVVEADGSVFPCDFYCLDEYKLGNLAMDSLSAVILSPINQKFTQRPHPMPSLCKECRYGRFCGGNCKRMQREICCSGDEVFCGYKAFLSEHEAPLRKIALQQRRYHTAHC